jgi:hypothetical protein
MARVVDYLPFAINVGANVEGQSSYVIEPIRLTGHQAGVAKSAVMNKSLRQHSVMVAALANLLSEALDIDVLDDGDVESLKNILQDVLMGGRSTILTTDMTLYVRTAGSNSNDGLTPTTAFATVQYAVDYAFTHLQLNGFILTIDVGGGTFSGATNIVAPMVGQRGSGGLLIMGAGKGSTTLSSQAPVFHFAAGGAGILTNMRMTSTGGTAWGDGSLIMAHNSQVLAFDIDFGAATSLGGGSFGDQIHSSISSSVQLGNVDKDYFYNISGGGRCFAAAYAGSVITIWNAKFTLTGTPAYSGAFIQSSGSASVQCFLVAPGTGTAFSGAATGPHYWVDGASTIRTTYGDGNATFFPGSTPGVVVNNNLQLNYA